MLRIKEVIKEKGSSVNELADKLNISRQALSKQIKGQMLIGTAQKIADSLGVPIWQLFVSPEEVNNVGSTLVCPHCGKPINIELKK